MLSASPSLISLRAGWVQGGWQIFLQYAPGDVLAAGTSKPAADESWLTWPVRNVLGVNVLGEIFFAHALFLSCAQLDLACARRRYAKTNHQTQWYHPSAVTPRSEPIHTLGESTSPCLGYPSFRAPLCKLTRLTPVTPSL